MRIAARGAGMQTTLLVSAVVLVAAFWLSVLSCRAPGAGDGAGGQSGDEGRRPRLLGAGGSASEFPAAR